MDSHIDLGDPAVMRAYLKEHENDTQPLWGENQNGEPVMVSACNGRVTIRTGQANGIDRVQTWYEADAHTDEHYER